MRNIVVGSTVLLMTGPIPGCMVAPNIGTDLTVVIEKESPIDLNELRSGKPGYHTETVEAKKRESQDIILNRLTRGVKRYREVVESVKLVRIETRLKAMPDEQPEALINWGHAICGAVVRSNVASGPWLSPPILRTATLAR